MSIMCKSSPSEAHKNGVVQKEELVRFDKVKASYDINDDTPPSFSYTVSPQLATTPQDWIGLFLSPRQDTRHPLAFTWTVPDARTGKKRKRRANKRDDQRHVTFVWGQSVLQDLPKKEGELWFQFVYVSKDGNELGCSRQFSIQGREPWKLVDDVSFTRWSPLAASVSSSTESEIFILSPGPSATSRSSATESPVLLSVPSDIDHNDDVEIVKTSPSITVIDADSDDDIIKNEADDDRFSRTSGSLGEWVIPEVCEKSQNGEKSDSFSEMSDIEILSPWQYGENIDTPIQTDNGSKASSKIDSVKNVTGKGEASRNTSSRSCKHASSACNESPAENNSKKARKSKQDKKNSMTGVINDKKDKSDNKHTSEKNDNESEDPSSKKMRVDQNQTPLSSGLASSFVEKLRFVNAGSDSFEKQSKMKEEKCDFTPVKNLTKKGKCKAKLIVEINDSVIHLNDSQQKADDPKVITCDGSKVSKDIRPKTNSIVSDVLLVTTKTKSRKRKRSGSKDEGKAQVGEREPSQSRNTAIPNLKSEEENAISSNEDCQTPDKKRKTCLESADNKQELITTKTDKAKSCVNSVSVAKTKPKKSKVGSVFCSDINTEMFDRVESKSKHRDEELGKYQQKDGPDLNSAKTENRVLDNPSKKGILLNEVQKDENVKKKNKNKTKQASCLIPNQSESGQSKNEKERKNTKVKEDKKSTKPNESREIKADTVFEKRDTSPKVICLGTEQSKCQKSGLTPNETNGQNHMAESKEMTKSLKNKKNHKKQIEDENRVTSETAEAKKTIPISYDNRIDDSLEHTSNYSHEDEVDTFVPSEKLRKFRREQLRKAKRVLTHKMKLKKDRRTKSKAERLISVEHSGVKTCQDQNCPNTDKSSKTDLTVPEDCLSPRGEDFPPLNRPTIADNAVDRISEKNKQKLHDLSKKCSIAGNTPTNILEKQPSVGKSKEQDIKTIPTGKPTDYVSKLYTQTQAFPVSCQDRRRPCIPAYLLDIMDALPESTNTPNLRHWRKSMAKRKGTKIMDCLDTGSSVDKLYPVKLNKETANEDVIALLGTPELLKTTANWKKEPTTSKLGKDSTRITSVAPIQPTPHLVVDDVDSERVSNCHETPESKTLNAEALETQCLLLDRLDEKNRPTRAKLRSARAVQLLKLRKKNFRQMRVWQRSVKESRNNSVFRHLDDQGCGLLRNNTETAGSYCENTIGLIKDFAVKCEDVQTLSWPLPLVIRERDAGLPAKSLEPLPTDKEDFGCVKIEEIEEESPLDMRKKGANQERPERCVDWKSVGAGKIHSIDDQSPADFNDFFSATISCKEHGAVDVLIGKQEDDAGTTGGACKDKSPVQKVMKCKDRHISRLEAQIHDLEGKLKMSEKRVATMRQKSTSKDLRAKLKVIEIKEKYKRIKASKMYSRRTVQAFSDPCGGQSSTSLQSKTEERKDSVINDPKKTLDSVEPSGGVHAFSLPLSYTSDIETAKWTKNRKNSGELKNTAHPDICVSVTGEKRNVFSPNYDLTPVNDDVPKRALEDRMLFQESQIVFGSKPPKKKFQDLNFSFDIPPLREINIPNSNKASDDILWSHQVTSSMNTFQASHRSDTQPGMKHASQIPNTNACFKQGPSKGNSTAGFEFTSSMLASDPCHSPNTFLDGQQSGCYGVAQRADTILPETQTVVGISEQFDPRRRPPSYSEQRANKRSFSLGGSSRVNSHHTHSSAFSPSRIALLPTPSQTPPWHSRPQTSPALFPQPASTSSCPKQASPRQVRSRSTTDRYQQGFVSRSDGQFLPEPSNKQMLPPSNERKPPGIPGFPAKHRAPRYSPYHLPYRYDVVSNFSQHPHPPHLVPSFHYPPGPVTYPQSAYPNVYYDVNRPAPRLSSHRPRPYYEPCHQIHREFVPCFSHTCNCRSSLDASVPFYYHNDTYNW